MGKVLVRDPGPFVRRASLQKKKLKVQAVALLEQSRRGPGAQVLLPWKEVGRGSLVCLPPKVLTSASVHFLSLIYMGSFTWDPYPGPCYPLQPGEAAAWTQLGPGC